MNDATLPALARRRPCIPFLWLCCPRPGPLSRRAHATHGAPVLRRRCRAGCPTSTWRPATAPTCWSSEPAQQAQQACNAACSPAAAFVRPPPDYMTPLLAGMQVHGPTRRRVHPAGAGAGAEPLWVHPRRVCPPQRDCAGPGHYQNRGGERGRLLGGGAAEQQGWTSRHCHNLQQQAAAGDSSPSRHGPPGARIAGQGAAQPRAEGMHAGAGGLHGGSA